MIDILFFAALASYFAASVLEFVRASFKSKAAGKAALFVGLAGLSLHAAYLVARGILAGRLPLSNQFEFACGFAWGIALLSVILSLRIRGGRFGLVAFPLAFLVMSYAALLPREITDLMPALRSAWFGIHIGSAVFSYAAFAVSGGLGILFLGKSRKGAKASDADMVNIDYVSYRLIAFGFLLLTVVILSGCVWAEQAWSTFWSWDPKETWALVTWIFYAVYLHLRLRKGWRGAKLAWFSVVAIACVIFTFIGVNQLLPGLHSYA